MTVFVFKVLNTWHMALLCMAVFAVYMYLIAFHEYKRLPKVFRAFNWLFLAAVYGWDYWFHPLSIDFRAVYRIAIALLIVGEIAYHGDVIAEMMERAAGRIKKWPTSLNGHR